MEPDRENFLGDGRLPKNPSKHGDDLSRTDESKSGVLVEPDAIVCTEVIAAHVSLVMSLDGRTVATESAWEAFAEGNVSQWQPCRLRRHEQCR